MYSLCGIIITTYAQRLTGLYPIWLIATTRQRTSKHWDYRGTGERVPDKRCLLHLKPLRLWTHRPSDSIWQLEPLTSITSLTATTREWTSSLRHKTDESICEKCVQPYRDNKPLWTPRDWHTLVNQKPDRCYHIYSHYDPIFQSCFCKGTDKAYKANKNSDKI